MWYSYNIFFCNLVGYKRGCGTDYFTATLDYAVVDRFTLFW